MNADSNVNEGTNDRTLIKQPTVFDPISAYHIHVLFINCLQTSDFQHFPKCACNFMGPKEGVHLFGKK